MATLTVGETERVLPQAEQLIVPARVWVRSTPVSEIAPAATPLRAGLEPELDTNTVAVPEVGFNR